MQHETNAMSQQCELCGIGFSGRSFKRRHDLAKAFCSIACVQNFEDRAGLPNGCIYESRPGWSSSPIVEAMPIAMAC